MTLIINNTNNLKKQYKKSIKRNRKRRKRLKVTDKVLKTCKDVITQTRLTHWGLKIV